MERLARSFIRLRAHRFDTLIGAQQATLATAVGNDIKGKISPILYLAAIPLAFVHQAIAGALYVIVALIWLVPDRRIERVATVD